MVSKKNPQTEKDAFPYDEEGPHAYWNSYLPIFLDRMNMSMRRHMTEEVSEYGLTSAHAVYLIALVMNGPMTQKDLSQFLDLDAANTTRVIKVLCDKGLAYDDREAPGSRNYRIHLTVKGEELGLKVKEQTVDWMDSMMSDVSPEEIATMRTVLLKMLHRMEPNLDDYMNSKYQDPFYTYLQMNPGGDSEFHVSNRVGKNSDDGSN